MVKKISKFKTFYEQLLELENSHPKTWYDLGTYLDSLKDQKKIRSKNLYTDFNSFLENVNKGIAFITFDYGIDGVSMEIGKYAHSFENLLSRKTNASQKTKVHLIGGNFSAQAQESFPKRWNKIQSPLMASFNSWTGYKTFFQNELKRGTEDYNELPQKIWKDALKFSKFLTKIIEKEDIGLLVPVNICSNPGNVSLPLALAIVSENLDIPVFNSNHDFYWENGMPSRKRKPGEKKGVRDHFFTNEALGEVFSVIELLYPWSSPLWFQGTINRTQNKKLIRDFAFNPINVGELPTSVDMDSFHLNSIHEKSEILKKVEKLFTSERHPKVTPINEFITKNDMSYSPSKSVILGNKKGVTNFSRSSLFFLQPTRVLRRKCIEKNFLLLEKLINDSDFLKVFPLTKFPRLTLMVTGPIAQGEDDYFWELVENFQKFLKKLPEKIKNKVFLCFAFGIDENLRNSDITGLTIEKITSASDLVLLPSQTEGRGLPIIEASAAKVPIICNRYWPEQVYSEVIGEHLSEEKRLKVIELPKSELDNAFIKSISKIFLDPVSTSSIMEHNFKVVKNRYSAIKLEGTFEGILHTIFKNTSSETVVLKNTEPLIIEYLKSIELNKNSKDMLYSKNRKYIPGYSQNEFMIILRSLVDPAAFRIEEREFKGKIMGFALDLVMNRIRTEKSDRKNVFSFFKSIDVLYKYYKGEAEIIFDHSLSYRHRHRRNYPWRKLTHTELKGLVYRLFMEYLEIDQSTLIPNTPARSFLDRKTTLHRILESPPSKIDDSDRLLRELESQKPFGYIPGKSIHYEFWFFILETIKIRFGLETHHLLTEKILKSNSRKIQPIRIFLRTETFFGHYSYNTVKDWLKKSAPEEFKILFRFNLIKLVRLKAISPGIHIAQIGNEALKELNTLRDSGGFIVTWGEDSYHGLDLIDVHSFRLGKARSKIFSSFLAIPNKDTFVQWVPPGLRSSITHPTPIQSPLQFHEALKSEKFVKLVKKYGEKDLLQWLKEESDKGPSTLKSLIETKYSEQISSKRKTKPVTTESNLCGLHPDGYPWSGSMIKIHSESVKNEISFCLISSGNQPKTVFELIEEFQKRSSKDVLVSWNGGYILNQELVGKLGISEDYVGFPLGLIIEDGKVTSLPLYNKPAFTISANGEPDIRAVNLKNGFNLTTSSGDTVKFLKNHRNCISKEHPTFFDLLSDQSFIGISNSTLVRFSGNTVIEIIEPQSGKMSILPVGLTVLIPKGAKFNFRVGEKVKFEIPELENIKCAVEAGPTLIDKSEIHIPMENEGWKTDNSISTQAARLDYLDMRGPKIALGLSKNNDVYILTVNGRIRESVGATHEDMARILMENGAVKAMGFDPGGSSTLIHKNQQMNVSPYNHDFMNHPYSLPPEARGVGNAIIAYLNQETSGRENS